MDFYWSVNVCARVRACVRACVRVHVCVYVREYLCATKQYISVLTHIRRQTEPRCRIL